MQLRASGIVLKEKRGGGVTREVQRAPERLRHRRRRLHRFARSGSAPRPRRPGLRARQLRSVLRPADQGAQPRTAFGAPVVLLPRGGYPRRLRPRPLGGGDPSRRVDPPGREGRGAPLGRRSRRLRGRERPRHDPDPRVGAGAEGSEGPLRLLLVRLRRQHEGSLLRGRLRRSPGEPLRGDEEGGGASLPHVLPPVRDERRGPALLHRVRPPPAPRDGDPQVHPPDPGREGDRPVRRRLLPEGLHLYRRHRLRGPRRADRAPGVPGLQPRGVGHDLPFGPGRADREGVREGRRAALQAAAARGRPGDVRGHLPREGRDRLRPAHADRARRIPFRRMVPASGNREDLPERRLP